MATTFTTEGYDARVELEHAPIGGFRGVVGVQSSHSDFAALGDEAYLPESQTTSRAIFVLEEFQAGNLRFEMAARQEWQDAEAVGRPSASHDPLSLSGGLAWDMAPGWSTAVSLSRSQRAPTAQELYARGVHLATNTYEIGVPTLDVETANALELSLRRTEGPTTFSASVYTYRYDGYIFAETLDRYEDFRLIRYTQTDADFKGFEFELSQEITPWLTGELFADYVRGKLEDGGNAPRIPAARLGVRAEYVIDDWSGDVEFYRVSDQRRVADFEDETPGYSMLNATVAYDFNLGGYGVQAYVRGTNLLDEVALNHASFLTNVAPLRGRNFVLGIRAVF